MTEYVCRAGPGDRPFEERHGHMTIAAVIAGSFRYHADSGQALLYPGAVMLGNFGTCYECGHEHSAGDRCVALHYAPALFEEIAASAAHSHRARFSVAMLPSLRTLAALLVNIETIASAADPAAAEELVIECAERVLATISGIAQSSAALSPIDARRVGAVLRTLEERADLPVDLPAMATMVGMSKYHFLRTFRRCTGVTPHQYLLELRMRRVGFTLRTTRKSISATAFEAGFGDLSTFNARFRDTFQMTPSEYRGKYGLRPIKRALNEGAEIAVDRRRTDS